MTHNGEKMTRRKSRITVSAALTALALIATTQTAHAQGQSWDDKYKDDPTLIISYEQTTEIRNDYSTISTVHTLTKVQKEAAKDSGQISLHYDSSRETIKNIEAYTITPEGKKIRATQINESSPEQDCDIITDEKIKKITMPNVTVGSSIDMTITMEAKPAMPGNYYETLLHSTTTPTKLMKYAITTPENANIRLQYHNGATKPVVTTAGGRKTFTWEIKDKDKMQAEEDMPPYHEVADIVTISSLDSWTTLSNWIWGLFKRNLVVSEPIAAKAREITAGKSTDAQKIQTIIDYIQTEFRYVQLTMDYHAYQPHSTTEIFANKYGDCKDYTIMGMAMLSAIGIKSYPVLYPSEPTLKADDLLPMPSYFNHSILAAEVAGKRHYIDLLQKGYPFPNIPSAMSNARVFVVNENGGIFDTIPQTPDENLQNTVQDNVTITSAGSATTETTQTLAADMSAYVRDVLGSFSPDDTAKLMQSIEFGMASGNTITHREWDNLNAKGRPITIHLSYEGSNDLQSTGDLIIFGLAAIPRGPKYSAPERRYPIASPRKTRVRHEATYTIPDDYEISSLPGAIRLSAGIATYKRTYEKKEGKIHASEEFITDKGQLPASRYADIQQFMDKIARLTKEKAVIKKKAQQAVQPQQLPQATLRHSQENDRTGQN